MPKADLSSFEAFKETANAFVGTKVYDTETTHLGEGRWEKYGREYETPGSDDRHAAAWYGFYLERCERRGVEPGPFSEGDDD